MVCIGDNLGAIGKAHAVARALKHDARNGGDVARASGLVENLIARAQISHRDEAARRSDWRVYRQRFTVALALFDVGPAKPSFGGVRALPAEQRADLERLRRMQLERAPFELAAGQFQHAGEKAQRARHRRQIPNQAALRSALKVVKMALGRVADVRPGNDRAAGDRLRPRRNRIT